MTQEEKISEFGSGDECDILEIIDTANGHTWLRVGTENIYDYYPSFVSLWSPMPS